MYPPREHQYVRVTGILKIFGNKRYINANGIQPISDPHELYFHLMEAMYVTLVHQHGPVHFSLLCSITRLSNRRPHSLLNLDRKPPPNRMGHQTIMLTVRQQFQAEQYPINTADVLKSRERSCNSCYHNHALRKVLTLLQSHAM